MPRGRLRLILFSTSGDTSLYLIEMFLMVRSPCHGHPSKATSFAGASWVLGKDDSDSSPSPAPKCSFGIFLGFGPSLLPLVADSSSSKSVSSFTLTRLIMFVSRSVRVRTAQVINLGREVDRSAHQERRFFMWTANPPTSEAFQLFLPCDCHCLSKAPN